MKSSTKRYNVFPFHFVIIRIAVIAMIVAIPFGLSVSSMQAADARQEDEATIGFDMDFDDDFDFDPFENKDHVDKEPPLEKPGNIDDAVEFDRWNDRYCSRLVSEIINKKDVDAKALVAKITELTEEDGAVYNYAVGYVYDQLMRRTFADDRSAESLDKYYQSAVEYYDKAVEGRENAVFYHFRGQADFFYADLKRMPEHYAMAVPFYTKAAEFAPEWERPLSMQGWCAFYLAEYDKAIALFEEAEKIDPESWEVKNGLAQTRAKLEKTAGFFVSNDANQTHITDLNIASETRDWSFLSTSQRIKPPSTTESYAFDRWNDVFRDIVTALGVIPPDDAPKLATLLTGLTEEDGKFYYYVCGYLCDRSARNHEAFREDNSEKAVEYFDRAIALDDGVAVFYHFRGQVNFHRGINTGNREFFEKALEDYQAAAACDPKWDMPFAMRGSACIQLKKHDEALAAFEHALERNDHRIEVLKDYVETVCYLVGSDEANAEIVEKALDLIQTWHRIVRDDVEKRMVFGFCHDPQIEELVHCLEYKFRQIDKSSNPEYYSKYDLFLAMRDACEQEQYDTAVQLSGIIESKEHRNIYSFFTSTGDSEAVENFLQTHPDYYLYSAESHSKEHQNIYSFFSGSGDSDAVENFLQAHPDYYLFRAECRYGIKEYEAALDDLNIFEEKIQDNVHLKEQYDGNIFRCRLMTLFRLGRYADVIELYQSKENALSLVQDNEAFVLLGLTFHRMGKDREMLECFFNRPSADFPWWVYRNEKEVEEVKEFHDLFINTFVKNVVSTSQETRPYQMSQVRVFADNVKYHVDNFEDYKRLLQLADLYLALNDFDQAAEMYANYLDFVPQDIEVTEKLIKTLEKCQKWEAAIQVASKLIAMNPENPDRWIARARLRGKYPEDSRPQVLLGDLSKAMELLGDEKSHRMAQLHFWRGEQFAKEYRDRQAIADWKTAMELTSPTQTFECIDGSQSRMPVERILDVFCSLCSDFDDGDHHGDLLADAVDFCSTAIKNGHDELLVLATRAQIYENIGKYQEAIDDYTVLVTFGLPENSTLTLSQCYFNISRCYETGCHLGTFPDMKRQQCFEKAFELTSLAIEHAKEPEARFYVHRHWLCGQILNYQLTDEQRKHYEEQMSLDRAKATELGHEWSVY